MNSSPFGTPTGAAFGLKVNPSAATLLRAGEQAITEHLGLLWRSGWQPLEVERQARLAGTREIADLVSLAILADHEQRRSQRIDPRWQAQIDELTFDDFYPGPGWLDRVRSAWQVTVQQICELIDQAVVATGRVMALDELIPPPGGPVRPAVRPAPSTDPMLKKVRALLAKAESTEFEAEAEALTAKAQELMTLHAIDHALLHPEDADHAPGVIRLPIDAPYADAKSWLLQVVAEASRCRAVFHPSVALSTVVGEPTDLAAVELLFTSLLVQAQHAMTSGARTAPPGSRTRSSGYRSSFLLSFTDRIGERLREINAAVFAASDADSSAYLPVLARQVEAVEAFMEERFPNIHAGGVRGGYDAAGWAGGRQAGDNARLSSGDLPAGS